LNYESIRYISAKCRLKQNWRIMLVEESGNECLAVMNKSLRHSGIDTVEDVPWGTRFCQFYQTKEDYDRHTCSLLQDRTRK